MGGQLCSQETYLNNHNVRPFSSIFFSLTLGLLADSSIISECSMGELLISRSSCIYWHHILIKLYEYLFLFLF